MGEGTFVGLDVHARSVVAGLIDEETGELAVLRAPIAPMSWWVGSSSWRPRCGSPTRPGRPASAWRAPARMRGSPAWWPRRA